MSTGLTSCLKLLSSAGLGRVGRSLLLGLLLLPLALAAKPIKFDIPAQPASEALLAFSKQAGVDVLYSFKDLHEVQSQALVGDFEPEAALAVLLKGTGFLAMRDESGKFVVTHETPKPGSVTSTVISTESGKPVEGARVRVVDTALGAVTDHAGRFRLTEVPAGTYSVVVMADDFMPTRVTDVTVRDNADVSLNLIDLRPKKEGVTQLQEYVVSAKKDVVELQSYEVSDTKVKPFSGASVDLPRTINDAQAYYIFDSKTIEQSGATNVNDFLKRRLTMNTTSLSNSQTGGPNQFGNTSSINLRGLGADKTLILVNGRRMANVKITLTDYQPDLNGIPMSAIDRIEVLPSSASGIYGGSAIGGVVNVILKKNYAGGELRATYDNTWDSDSPARTVSASYGMALEGGKTHVMLNASWSDAQSLLLQDRQNIFRRNVATINKNAPDWFASSGRPFLGALPNIINQSGSYNSDFSVYTPDPLVLKPAYGGTTLSSGLTYIPAGTSNTTPLATLGAGLVANAGSQNFDLPRTTQPNTGLLRPFGVTPENKAFQASVNRQMLPKLELFADFSYNENNSTSVNNPFYGSVYLPSSSPTNPFTSDVRISVLDPAAYPITTESTNRSYTVGAIAQLPWNWTGEFDYSWSENQYNYLYYNQDDGQVDAMVSGGLNPFVDAVHYPLNNSPYLVPLRFAGSTSLKDLALRGSGPLPSLPWGAPNLTVGLERRTSATPDTGFVQTYPFSPFSSSTSTYFAREAVTASGYGELTVPLMKKDWLPFVHTLELQASGRSERYTVDAGTPSSTYRPATGTTTFSSPTLGGKRYDARAKYTSTNGTAGLKFQPVPELTLRASIASAFLPPTPAQLIQNPEPNSFRPSVNDPKTGTRYSVSVLGGGNPNLTPQTSKSFNAGAIWEPTAKALKGLRFNAEYYKIDQYNAIGTLPNQTIVDLESTFPGRVTRNASGLITLLDASSINLYKRETEGWDLSADYTLKTDVGTFNLMAVESIIVHLRNQYSLTLPEFDAVNFPSESGAAKYKANATLTWDWHNWTASWTTSYYGSYKQYGAVGGPSATQNGAPSTGYTGPQGSDTIPSQTYQDLFISYAFGKQHAKGGSKLGTLGSSLLDGLTMQLGVRNVFNKAAPFDVYYDTNYYESPYGDMRLRSYWLSVKKTF